MKKNKILVFFLLSFCICLLTGCSNNNSPDSLASNVVDLLSDGSIEKVSSYFYVKNGDFFDKLSFVELIKEKGLNIENNKMNKIVDVGSELKDDDGNSIVKVSVLIDNNKVFGINTIKVDEKWYIYDNTFHDNDIRIIVPKGTTVKINDVLLDESYLETINLNVKASHPDLASSKSISLNNVEIEAYVLKNPIIGVYKITLEGDKVINDEIYTYTKYGSQMSTNYTSIASYTEGTTYFFNLTNDSNKVEYFVNDYLKDIYSNIVNNHSMNEVTKYFDKESPVYSIVESAYANAITNFGNKDKTSFPNYYYDEFDVKNLKIHRINYYNDDNITVSLSYDLDYKYHEVYQNEVLNTEKSYTKDIDTIMILRKNSEGNYVITNGYSLFIY